jgi:hypothetical protein
VLTGLDVEEGSTEPVLRSVLPHAATAVSRGLNLLAGMASNNSSSSSSGAGAASELLTYFHGLHCIITCCDLFVLVIRLLREQTHARRAAVELAVLVHTSGESRPSAQRVIAMTSWGCGQVL